MRFVILGDGVAGMSAAEAIRVQRPRDEILVVSNDPHPYYYRASLTNFVMGELTEEELFAAPDAFERMGVRRVSATVGGLDLAGKAVRLVGKEPLAYDRLLIATGASARRLEPKAPGEDDKRRAVGADHPHVGVLRTYADAMALVDRCRQVESAVVYGGGILGIEAAQGLREHVRRVTLVHANARLLEKVLDRTGSELLERRMTDAGVRVHLSSRIEAIRSGKKGITSVVLGDGKTELAAEMVVVALGNVPNTAWLEGSGIVFRSGSDRSLPVDRAMRVRTAAGPVDDVFAAGDVVAFHDDSLPFQNPGGLWQPAKKQGYVAGVNMAAERGAPATEYRPGVLYNATRAWDLDLGSLGRCVELDEQETAAERAAYREIAVQEMKDGVPVHKKLLLKGGRIAGALLLGDRREGHALRRIMNLSGVAGDVTAIADRIFDAQFDLFRWVKDVERQAGVAVREAPLAIARGATPAGLERTTTKVTRPPLLVEGGSTHLLRRPEPRKLTLVVGEARTTFAGSPARIGQDLENQVVVADPSLGDERIVLTPEGALWIASSVGAPRPQALLNGVPLARPRVLFDNDLLALGTWHGRVEMASLAPAGASAGAPRRLPRAWLLGPRRVDLGRRPLVIGSSPDAGIVLGGKGVEPRHAQIRAAFDPPSYLLADGPSDGGTFVNGERLTVPRRLADGDTIRIGSETLTFGMDAPGASATSASAAASGVGAGAPLPGTAWLVGLEGPLARRALTVPSGAVLGRGAEAAVAVNDPLVSREHARVERGGDGWTIADVGSDNGVFVDGERSAVDVRVRVADGTRVRIGRTTYRFQSTPPTERAVTAEEAAVGSGRTATVRLREDGPRFEIEQGDTPLVIPLAGDDVTIGKEIDNVVVLLPDDVSRRHAILRRRDREYALEDLRSTNGTRVNGVPLAPGAPRLLADGDRLHFGPCSVLYRRGVGVLSSDEAGPAARAILRLLDPVDPKVTTYPLVGNGPFQIGRAAVTRKAAEEAKASAWILVPQRQGEEFVSRRHARIVHEQGVWTLEDLGSSYGTTVRRKRLEPGQREVLHDGDTFLLQNQRVRFELAAPPGARVRRAGRLGNVVERGEAGDPLEVVLDARTVHEELDACIGCHDCMVACPLPDSRLVTIGALNALASGMGEANEVVARFVDQCIQCHQCVPVCPVDIRRSRIVLWNKLKLDEEVPADRRLSVQVADGTLLSDWTVGALVDRLGEHALLAPLGVEARRKLAGAARVRRLLAGETLLEEGTYADAAWIVVEGECEVGVDRGAKGFRRTTLAGRGSTLGLDALLAEDASDLTVRARTEATVVGFARQVLEQRARIDRRFAEALAALRVDRSVEGLLAGVPALAGIGGKAREALASELLLESRLPGRTVLSSEQVADTFAVVRRGFVREVRQVRGQEVVASYLRPGESFGGRDSGRPGLLLGYVADTRAEVAFLEAERLAVLERRHPGLREALFPAGGASTAGLGGSALGGASDGFPRGHQVLRIDTRLCVDCDNCVSACERRHGLPRLDRLGASKQVGPFQIPASCYHCVDPECLHCDVDGIVRLDTGEITITDTCHGCGLCAERCPYDNIQMVDRAPPKKPWYQRVLPDPILSLLRLIDEESSRAFEKVAVKCDLCAGYESGPACVRSCPVGAAQRIDWVDMIEEEAAVARPSASGGARP